MAACAKRYNGGRTPRVGWGSLVGLRSAPASRRPPPDAQRTTTQKGDIISRVLKGTFLKSFDNRFLPIFWLFHKSPHRLRPAGLQDRAGCGACRRGFSQLAEPVAAPRPRAEPAISSTASPNPPRPLSVFGFRLSAFFRVSGFGIPGLGLPSPALTSRGDHPARLAVGFTFHPLSAILARPPAPLPPLPDQQPVTADQQIRQHDFQMLSAVCSERGKGAEEAAHAPARTMPAHPPEPQPIH